MVLMAEKPKASTPDKKKVIAACACPSPGEPKDPSSNHGKRKDPSSNGNSSWSADWISCALLVGGSILLGVGLQKEKAGNRIVARDCILFGLAAKSLTDLVYTSSMAYTASQACNKCWDWCQETTTVHQAKATSRKSSYPKNDCAHAETNDDSYYYQIAKYMARAGMTYSMFFAVDYFGAKWLLETMYASGRTFLPQRERKFK